MRYSKNSKKQICLLGASFDTGNLGISALAESSIKIILHKFPDAQIFIFGSGYKPKESSLLISGRQLNIEVIPLRFSKNILLPCHFLMFIIYGLIIKILPGSSLKKSLANRNQYFRKLYETDLAVDITGGDSFSDIYGMHRFIVGFLQKWLIIFLGKDLIFLPQTYGPFERRITKVLAKYILRRAEMIYARDQESLKYVKNILRNYKRSEKIKFIPDVAFVLDPHELANMDIGAFVKVRKEDSVVVGLNISGLLYNGGYKNNNMFGLKSNYPDLVVKIIELLLKDTNTLVILVPHVLTIGKYEFISDGKACNEVYKKLSEKYKDRIFFAQGQYNHNEIKHIISLCDFFVGSRMHSCIAALSQNIPAVGVAYSRKFIGVFESINMADYVADARDLSQEEILDIIHTALTQRDKIRKHLKSTIPHIKADIMDGMVLES